MILNILILNVSKQLKYRFSLIPRIGIFRQNLIIKVIYLCSLFIKLYGWKLIIFFHSWGLYNCMKLEKIVKNLSSIFSRKCSCLIRITIRGIRMRDIDMILYKNIFLPLVVKPFLFYKFVILPAIQWNLFPAYIFKSREVILFVHSQKTMPFKMAIWT